MNLAGWIRRSDRDTVLMHRRTLRRVMRWDPDLPAELVERMWRDPHALLTMGQVLHQKPRCTVVKLDYDSRSFVFKYHNWGQFGRMLKRSLARSSARKSWLDGRYLQGAGIPTPRPRAFFEWRAGPLGTSSYVLSDYVEGTSLYRYMRFGQPCSDVVNHLAEQLAAIWQRLDELHVCHNDLKTENLLIDPQRRLWLIDLEKMRRYRRASRARHRQFKDARDLLHPRNWRANPAAAAVFRDHILKTLAGLSLLAAPGAEASPLRLAIESTNRDTDLVTVLIPCLNAAETIAACVAAVRDMADEILVADGGSSDDTLDVVRAIGGCRVLQRHSADPVAFHNWAAAQATHAWVLHVQPDERVNPELSRQVQDALAAGPSVDGFRVVRSHHFWGHRVRYGGFQDDAPIRLFRKEVGHYELRDGRLEISIPTHRVGRLGSSLVYEACRSVDQYLADARQYDDLSTPGKARSLRPTSAIWQACRQALRLLVVRHGWLDGWAGLQAAWLAACAVYLRQMRHWEQREFSATHITAVDDHVAAWHRVTLVGATSGEPPLRVFEPALSSSSRTDRQSDAARAEQQTTSERAHPDIERIDGSHIGSPAKRQPATDRSGASADGEPPRPASQPNADRRDGEDHDRPAA